ncbi:MAG: D-sedoheptulose 7-phosphate isomerase [Verrucomicrobiota bacterium]|jgi:D-sedoheptulose 7-phosphate isomerase
MTNHLSRLIERYPILASCSADISSAIELLSDLFSSGNKLLICGNGGSAADSEHMVGELMKGFMKPRKIPPADAAKVEKSGGPDGAAVAANLQGALPAIALTSQLSLNTAVANDTHAEMIFAQQVYGLGQKGDAVLGISTSGNSRNVINAFIVARALELKTIALTGRGGGLLPPFADVMIRVPADTVLEIQELHLPVYHTLCVELEERFFPA